MDNYIIPNIAGSNRSFDEINVCIEPDNVVKPLKKKGGLQILKNPINYFSGMLLYLIVLFVLGCEKPKTVESIAPVSYQTANYHYIVGYDACSGVEIVEDETSKAKGYLLISDDLKDTLLTYNLPDSLFVFPIEIMPTNVFGFNFFPEQYRFKYKIQMNYQIASEGQKIAFPCVTLYPQLYSIEPVQVIITSIL
jgi:hypothetical protein